MRLAKRAVTVMLLAVTAGCTTDVVPALPPTATGAIVRLYHTADTSDLLERTGNFEAELVFESRNHQQLVADLDAGRIEYFVTHHRPAEAERWSAPLARDGLAIIRHPDNPVNDLSLLDVKQIYRGFTSNWGDVGGANLPITTYSYAPERAISLESARLLMGQEQITPNAQIMPSSTRMIERIQADPQGIGFVPISALTSESLALSIEGIRPSVDTITDNRYPLQMTIYALGREEPSDLFRDFFLWVQSSGQDLLEPQFVPLPR